MPPKVLIVDDNMDIIKLLKRRLRKKGYEIFSAENGEIGVNKVFEIRPDITLMDMHMPVMDGHNATRLLREKGYRGLIVALTASAMADDVKLTKEAGCDYFISKPIDTEFEQKIEKFIKETREI